MQERVHHRIAVIGICDVPLLEKNETAEVEETALVLLCVFLRMLT